MTTQRILNEWAGDSAKRSKKSYPGCIALTEPSVSKNSCTPPQLASLPISTRREGFLAAAEFLGEQQRLILSSLIDCPLTDLEIAAQTGIRLSSVNARRNELRKKGLVVVAGKQWNNESRCHNVLWKVTL